MDIIDAIVRKLLIIISGLMTTVVVLQVISRYLLKSPLVWTEEVARYLMLWMAFIGASCIIKQWDNIYVDFLINPLKNKPKKIVMLLQKLVVLGVIIYSFYLCFTIFPNVGAYQRLATLDISMLWAQSSMTVGFFLTILQNIGVILNDLFIQESCSGEDTQC
jgi:TRAP-type C4-dicarboxylate transport system permease small subunit